MEGLWEDNRLYGVKRWHLERPKDWWMLVPVELLSSVVFLGEKGKLGGTGFFVDVDLQEGTYRYLVTASHCVWDWEHRAPRIDLFARVNNPAGGTLDIELPDGDEWTLHPENEPDNPSIDIAILPWSSDALFRSGYRTIRSTMLLREDLFGNNPDAGVGFADEVAAVGLFTIHVGTDHNEPIVRTGNIAMIPSEPVETVDYMGAMQLYLVELRSIGGMSGSPVFVLQRTKVAARYVPISLLGVLLGHYKVDRKNIADDEPLNLGIGMVAPARFLLEILDRRELIKERERIEREKARRKGNAVMDSAADDRFTKTDFEDALRKATRKTDQPKRGKRTTS